MNDKMCTVWFKDYTCDPDFKLRIGKVKGLFRSFENIKGIWLNERNKPKYYIPQHQILYIEITEE